MFPVTSRKLLGAASIFLSLGFLASGQTIGVVVAGNQGPWQQSLNPNFNYGQRDNVAPTVVSAASGIPFVGGGTITLTYVAGLVNVYPTGGFPATDANGYAGVAANQQVIAPCGSYPSYYMNQALYPIYASELVGAFAINGQIVGLPFPIGNGPATFVIPAAANQLLLGVNDDCYSDNQGSWVVNASYAPLVVSSVLNGASLQPGIVPGSWATAKGVNLSGITDNWDKAITNGVLPATLDGVTMTVGGQPAYISYVSPGQINFLVPNIGTGPQQVVVQNSFGASVAFAVNSNTYGPALFPWPGGQVVATHQDFTYAAKSGTFAGVPTSPAKAGETVILWGTGFGPAAPTPPLGKVTPGDQTYSTTTLPQVSVANQPATVYGAALAPGYAGLYQVAIQVPSSLITGDWPVTVAIGGVSSVAGNLSVQQQ